MRFLHNDLHQYSALQFFRAKRDLDDALSVTWITFIGPYFPLTIVKIFKCEIAGLPLNSA